MNKKVLRKIKKKYNVYKRYLSTKSGQDYQRCIRERNKCTKLLRKTRKEYEKQVAKEGKTNPKNFWRYVQERMKTNSGISSLKKNDGSLVVKDIEKAETLNEFFSSVFIREDTTNVPFLNNGSMSEGISLYDIRVTPEAIRSKLQELNPNKSHGPDEIPPKVLKEVSEELSLPLCNLYNKSLETGSLPEDWKTAEVIALYKKGSKSDDGNYRPISLTCIVCKVLESLIRDAIVSHFTCNNLYAHCQHDF